jgi:exodeoxyribonuclease-1
LTFYFFDLETSGFRTRIDRIMQFAGQRTDMDLRPIGRPDNFLVKMTADTLPEPGAVLVHGITPQKTLQSGITEAELCEHLTSQVSVDDTILVGYNNIRFDNEFIRFTLWRNFYDAYEWSWKNNCSIWDLLDVVRMARALRPEGIEWPFAPDGKPTNSLEYITAVNKLEHADAHDAMSDVSAVIAVARLLKSKQPELFEYLLNIRGKRNIAALVGKGDPLLYTSGRYAAEFNKTTAAVAAVEKPDKSGALMFDLRVDPDEFKDMTAGELASRWKAYQTRADNAPYFPVKELKYNRCPALAPMNWLDDAGFARLQLHPEAVAKHLEKLKAANGFGGRLLEALEGLWPPRQPSLMVDDQQVDGQLYDRFIKDEDRTKMSVVRAAEPEELSKLIDDFSDERLRALLPLYKARNFPESLSNDEKSAWTAFRHQRLEGGKTSWAERYFSQLNELEATPGLSESKKHLIKDLREYGKAVTREA